MNEGVGKKKKSQEYYLNGASSTWNKTLGEGRNLLLFSACHHHQTIWVLAQIYP